MRVTDNAMPRQIKSNRDDTLYYYVDTITGNGGQFHIYVDDTNQRVQITTDDLNTVNGCGPRFRVHAW
jgi:hypothetical protein